MIYLDRNVIWPLDEKVGVCEIENPKWDPKKVLRSLKRYIFTLREKNTNKPYGNNVFNLAEFYLWMYSCGGMKWNGTKGDYNTSDADNAFKVISIWEEGKLIKPKHKNDDGEWTVWEITRKTNENKSNRNLAKH